MKILSHFFCSQSDKQNQVSSQNLPLLVHHPTHTAPTYPVNERPTQSSNEPRLFPTPSYHSVCQRTYFLLVLQYQITLFAYHPSTYSIPTLRTIIICPSTYQNFFILFPLFLFLTLSRIIPLRSFLFLPYHYLFRLELAIIIIDCRHTARFRLASFAKLHLLPSHFDHISHIWLTQPDTHVFLYILYIRILCCSFPCTNIFNILSFVVQTSFIWLPSCSSFVFSYHTSHCAHLLSLIFGFYFATHRLRIVSSLVASCTILSSLYSLLLVLQWSHAPFQSTNLKSSHSYPLQLWYLHSFITRH